MSESSSATEIAAWWGAIIATLVLVWDFIKWKMSGPRLDISVLPDMQTYGGLEDDNNSYVMVEVRNTGDKKTTITHLVGFQFKSKLDQLRHKPLKSFVVAQQKTTQPIPYVLEPGEMWMGGLIQDEELEAMSKEELLYCGIYHSSRNRPLLKRVVIDEQ